jgi:hypothetical protein
MHHVMLGSRLHVVSDSQALSWSMIDFFNSYCKNFVGYFPDIHSFWKILPGHNAIVVIFFINLAQKPLCAFKKRNAFSGQHSAHVYD